MHIFDQSVKNSSIREKHLPTEFWYSSAVYVIYNKKRRAALTCRETQELRETKRIHVLRIRPVQGGCHNTVPWRSACHRAIHQEALPHEEHRASHDDRTKEHSTPANTALENVTSLNIACFQYLYSWNQAPYHSTAEQIYIISLSTAEENKLNPQSLKMSLMLQMARSVPRQMPWRPFRKIHSL